MNGLFQITAHNSVELYNTSMVQTKHYLVRLPYIVVVRIHQRVVLKKYSHVTGIRYVLLDVHFVLPMHGIITLTVPHSLKLCMTTMWKTQIMQSPANAIAI